MKKCVRGSDIWYKSYNSGSSAKLQQGRVVETPRTGESVKVAPFCGGLLGSVCTKDWNDIVETSHMHLIEHLHSCGYDVESALRSIPHPKPSLNLEERETADAFIASRYSHVFIKWSCLQIILCSSSTLHRKKGTTTVQQLRQKLPEKGTGEIVEYFLSQYVMDSDAEDDVGASATKKVLERERLDDGERSRKLVKAASEHVEHVEMTDLVLRLFRIFA